MRHRPQQRRFQLVRAAHDGRLARRLGAPSRAVGQLRRDQRGEQQQHQAERFVGAGNGKRAARIDEQQVVAEDGDDGGGDGRTAAPTTGGQDDRDQVQQDGRWQIDDGLVQDADDQEGRAHAQQRDQVGPERSLNANRAAS